MKINFLLTTFLLGSLATQAQMTLTNSGMVITSGSHQNLQQSNNPFDEGGTGYQTWDFSTFSGSATSIDFASCSVVGDCGSFGNANLVSGANGDWGANASVAYYHIENNVISNMGLKAQGVAFHYSDPEDLFRFPFAYGNSYTDHFKCTFSNTGVDFIREGNSTVTADAYGTIKLPSGTYNNALRLRLHQEYSDSVPSMQMTTANYVSDNYTWYVPGLNSYIFATSNISVNGIMGTQNGTYNTAIPSTTGINNISAESIALKLFPIPAVNTLNIGINKNDVEIKSGHIYDIVGKKYELPISIINQQNLSFNTSALANGMYYVQLETTAGIVNKKFEIYK